MGISDTDPDLFDAAEFGDLEWVQQSIDSVGLDGESINVDAQDNGGETILMVATRYNHIEIVRFLLEKGADPNIKDNKGQTVLMKAKDRDYSEIVDLLIKSGVES